MPEMLLTSSNLSYAGTCFAFMCFSALITVVFLRDMGKVGAKKTKKPVEPAEEGNLGQTSDKLKE